jgi:hypothetical protein
MNPPETETSKNIKIQGLVQGPNLGVKSPIDLQ